MDAQGIEEPKQLQGREAVAAWMVSGKPLQAYCEETGQSYWALRRWRLKFGEELGVAIKRRPGAAKASSQRSLPRARMKFVPIEIGAAEQTKPAFTVEIRLRGERTIVIGADVACETLSRLVVAIERAS